MQNDSEQNEANTAPAKRMRRPNVRLNQPYYENPGHLRLPKNWRPLEKDVEGAKRVRTLKTIPVKSKKNGGTNEGNDGEDEAMNLHNDLAVRNWRNFGGIVNKDFKPRPKLKRVSPSASNKEWGSAKPQEIEDQNNEKFILSSYVVSEKEGEEGKKRVEEEEEERLDEEENFVPNGSDRNFAPENSDPSSPDRSFDGEKMIDDDNDIGGNQGKNQSTLPNRRDPYEIRGEMEKRDEDGDGVRVWLNQLGLSKYAPLFEMHEVDEEVLPFLTLEDLKDMGINAVGSRRKMYYSIQKLGKGST